MNIVPIGESLNIDCLLDSLQLNTQKVSKFLPEFSLNNSPYLVLLICTFKSLVVASFSGHSSDFKSASMKNFSFLLASL